MDFRKAKRKERFDRNFKRISYKTIKTLKDIDKGYNIDFFYDCLDNMFVQRNNKYLNDKPIIGTFCAMVPEEIILACGGMPVKLCGGNYISQIAGEEIAPRDSCPVVKATVGAFDMKLLNTYENCKLVIVPTSCDGKKKMAEIIAGYVKTIPLHIPALKDQENFEEIISIYMGLIDEIEKVTGKKLTKKRLRRAIKLTQAINKQAYIFMQNKRMNPAVISGTHAMAVINAYQYCDRELYLKELTKLNNILKEKVRNKEFLKSGMSRILITGSPMVFPNMKIPIILEKLDSVISADETCAGDRMLSDPVCIVDNSLYGMIKALACKCILPCTCPTFVYNTQRMYRLKQMVHDYEIDGIVYNVLRGCLPYDFEVRNVEKLSQEIGIPIIRVETDYNTEDIEQVQIRLEAFVEMLKMKG